MAMSEPRPPYLVGEQVQLQHRGERVRAYVTLVHPVDNGWEVVARTIGTPAAAGALVNVFTTSARSTFLEPVAGVEAVRG